MIAKNFCPENGTLLNGKKQYFAASVTPPTKKDMCHLTAKTDLEQNLSQDFAGSDHYCVVFYSILHYFSAAHYCIREALFLFNL